MSGAAKAEFSRIVPLARLGTEPFRQEIVADEAERAALARRFDLLALDRLAAAVELTRCGSGLILLRAVLTADFVQSCVVTLDPVPGAINQEFALLYGAPEAEAEAERMAGGETAFEPLVAGLIDIGEAVAQEFSLALPLFPRSPGAGVATEMPDAAEVGPFAALSSLGRREP